MEFMLARLGPPGQNKFRLLGWAGVVGLVLVALLAPASPVLSNDTPGNNGTVKIHDGNTENDPGEVRNEPHVCTFHLHFYFSDPEQAGTWEIQEWSPGDKGTVVLNGDYDTHGDGEDRQPEDGVYTLDPGHYKLFWDGDLDTEKHDKMKVFWVDCETTTTTTESTTTGETTVSGTTTEETTTEATTTGETTVSGTTTEETTSGETTVSGTTTEETTTGETTVSGTTTGETTTGETTTGETTVSGTTTGETTTTSTAFSQTVSGETTSAGPTLPNTATVTDAPSGTGRSSVSLLAAALAFLLGSILLLTPSRARKRE